MSAIVVQSALESVSSSWSGQNQFLGSLKEASVTHRLAALTAEPSAAVQRKEMSTPGPRP